MKKTIIEVVTELTGQIPVQYSGELKAIKCFMHDDSKPSLVLYENTQSWFCYPCSQGGDIYRFVALYKGIPYHAAKTFLDGNLDALNEITETLDGLHVKDEIDYAEELNFQISKYCRDLMYRRLELVDNVLAFLQKFDNEYLTKPVTSDILKQVIEESRGLEK